MSAELDARLRGVPLNDLRVQCRTRGLSPAGDQYALRERLKEHMIGTNDFSMLGGGGGPPSDGGYGQSYGGPGGDLPPSRGAISQMGPGGGSPYGGPPPNMGYGGQGGGGPGYGGPPSGADYGGPPPGSNYGGGPPPGSTYGGGPPGGQSNPWARPPHSSGGPPPGADYGGPPTGNPYGGPGMGMGGGPPMGGGDFQGGSTGPQYGRRAPSRERQGGPPSDNVGGNNYSRPSGSQNVGNFISDRPTSRVLAPPGGVSQISFGGGSDAPTPPRAPHRTIQESSPYAQGSYAVPQPYSGAPPQQSPYGNTYQGSPGREIQRSSGAYGSGAYDKVDPHMKNNYSRPSGMQNVGNFITDRPSSKVLAPPGGKCQISFG